MRKLTAIFILCLLSSFHTLSAQETQEKSKSIKSSSEEYTKFRFGGYGEIVAKFKDYGINRFYGGSDGNANDQRNTISIPRFVLAFDYKFNSKWILGAEIEFESGGTGTALELENSENGEYETEIEKGGEVALEQFHITRLINPAFNIRAGHMIVPVGLTNAHHEPTLFFGTSRPEGETTILPSTWHETGLAFFGSFGKGHASFDYQAMVVTGLNANGFDRNTWVASGKQGFFEEDNFTSPAYVARLDYKGVLGLRVGASFYYCVNAGSNSDKAATYSKIGSIPVRIYTADAQYLNKYVTARGNIVYGNLGNSAALSGKNTQLSNLSPYSRITPIAKNAVSYAGEVGVNIRSIFNNSKIPVIYPFARYEYYNPQEKGEKRQTMDKRNQVSMWTAGLNWYALPNLVIKADYTTRKIGTSKIFGKGRYNSENEFAIGIAYIGWFIKK
ncbi:porin [Bacteroides sp.]|uniref:porin n=1 Tax=Bacteroides sp. TaxID=29523 RepID=UPI00260AABD1|nr:porin [Bacteroides sp.]MDD3040348.1 porin [Bacteroides sp.]